MRQFPTSTVLVSLLLCLSSACTAEPPPQKIGLDAYVRAGESVAVDGVRDNLSGISFNRQTGTLFCAINYPPMIIEIDKNGQVLRRFPISGGGDTEGIVCLDKRRVAVAEEGSCELVVFNLPELPQGESGVIQRGAAESVLVEPDNGNNIGLEGIAYDPDDRTFYMVKEMRPSRLYKVELAKDSDDIANAVSAALWNFAEKKIDVLDTAGCHFHSDTGNLLVVSDESSCVIEVTPDGKELSRLYVRMQQPEGVTMDDEGTLYIVSEPSWFYTFKK